jgi:hypothetical protein
MAFAWVITLPSAILAVIFGIVVIIFGKQIFG